jgi:hypothetical protein
MVVTETIAANVWDSPFSETQISQATQALESGKILVLPNLPFNLLEGEHSFLTPAIANPQIKNINYDNRSGVVHGAIGDSHTQQALMTMLQRFSLQARQLVNHLLSHYQATLITARTSFRPVEILGRATSYKKDDTRLHVDAFPANPNQGKRILRVFTNINLAEKERVWHIGDAFETVARHFLPRIRKPLPGSAIVLNKLNITKSLRTHYDHTMLQIHDLMKADLHYQATVPQVEVRFAPGTTWIVQTDHVSHAAMRGQHVLEQTFYLPVQAMQDETHAPLRILERIMQRRLV